MKKVLAIILAALLVFALVGCSGGTSGGSGSSSGGDSKGYTAYVLAEKGESGERAGQEDPKAGRLPASGFLSVLPRTPGVSPNCFQIIGEFLFL